YFDVIVIVYVFVLIAIVLFVFFFFFSSRRRHTRCYRDWSSDVCSSDLPERAQGFDVALVLGAENLGQNHVNHKSISISAGIAMRSEERRVGKECRYRWAADH